MGRSGRDRGGDPQRVRTRRPAQLGGSAERRRWTLDLGGELPATPPPPEDVEFASLLERPAAIASMYDVACTTAPELGGHLARQAESLHDWHAYELGGSLVLDLTVVAAAGDDVVGFSTLRRVGEGERVEIRTLRVLSEWRRRGIARALVLTQAHGARAQGAATMQMLLRTTAAVGLAANLGFRPESVTVDYRGPLFDDA